MAAIVEIDESNEAVEVVTSAISRADYGATDAPNLDRASSSIAAGSQSYEKWWRWHLVSLGGATAISTLRFYASLPANGADLHQFNGATVQATYAGANHRQTVYSQPVTTTTRTPELVPTTDPGVANIGIGGLLAGTLSAAGWSDYLVSQVRVDAGSVTGIPFDVYFSFAQVA